ncbi:MAG: TlpA disulfide reductase family protein [Jiangellaceae bacterium]
MDLTFTATTVDGEQFAGSSLAGRPAVLWFWAPWCPTCVAEAPDVLAVADRHGDQVAGWGWPAWVRSTRCMSSSR